MVQRSKSRDNGSRRLRGNQAEGGIELGVRGYGGWREACPSRCSAGAEKIASL